MAIYDGMAIQSGSVRYGNIAFAVAGQIVDLYFNEIVSAPVKTADLEFGSPVNFESDGSVTLLTDGTAITAFKGIAVRELAREMDVRGVAGVTKYLVGATAGIIRTGHIYVKVAADALVGAAIGGLVYTKGGVYYGSANGAATDGLVALPGLTFETVATAGNVAEVRLA